jgi:hypothetical protein
MAYFNPANAYSGYSGFGAQGAQGAKGSTGAQGVQGTAGTNGTNGTQGAAGPQGLKGSTGSPGTQGASGYSGFSGVNGVQGAQGATGAQGNQGATGTNGTNGAQGFQGNQGATGAQGNQGAQGSSGYSGAFAGTGTTNNLAKFTGASSLGNSTVTDNGTVVLTSVALSATGKGGFDAYKVFTDGSGNITAVSYTSTSSRVSKTNIRPLSTLIVDALGTTQQLTPVVYDSLVDTSATNEIGLIAEDVKPILPSVVYTDDNGNVIGIDYSRFSALLIDTIKTLSNKINELSAKLPS